jgi:helicase SWR1
MDDETLQRVSKLHAVLRPYLLRRSKRDIEKELPHKYDHLLLVRYPSDNDFSTMNSCRALNAGGSAIRCLPKSGNHPDPFEVRPIVTSFAMERSAIADFEIKELLIRRRLLQSTVDYSLLTDRTRSSLIAMP